ncbi:cytosolic Prostaglandin E synthase-like [Choristoneura fumiferana]|uniref:cytosolic Prostaglandin E synthase-like n=1 Tax=Choristoneura fumiferana TaxID=7141 RepID=UPI003D15DDD6
MSAETITTPPSVSWAQRSTRVFLTFNVECEKPDIKIEKKSISFKGLCAPGRKLHEVDIPLYAEIDVEKSTQINKGRYIEVVLMKDKTDDSFWPTLTSDKKKHHWLKVDFNRWQDEDESDEELNDMNDMFSNKMGPFGDDIEKDDSSSAEEDLPDIE